MPARHARLVIAGVLLVAVCAATGDAHAEPKPEPSIEQAKLHFARAEQHKNGKRYVKAALEYLKAHRLFPDPEFFFNAAEMYFSAERYRDSLKYYRKYLEAEPDGRGSEYAGQRIQWLERRLKDEPGPEARRPEPAPGDGTDQQTGDEPQDGPGATLPIDRPPSADRSPGSGQRLTGIALMLAGAATVSVGVKFGLDARSASNAITDHTGSWTDELLARQAEGRRAQQLSWTLYGTGAAVLVLGGILYISGARAGARRDDAVTVAPTVQNPGFVVSGSF